MDIQTPELDKIAKVRDKSQIIGDFLEWLNSKSYIIGEWKEINYYEEEDYKYNATQDRLVPLNKNITKFLEEYFNIDENKAEQERQQILDDLRKKST